MALPKLNDTPKYQLTIPSTQKQVRFRPYLVKEEKVLLMAFESGDEKATLGAVLDTIESCVEDRIQRNKLTTFDVEYMFTQIRAKSVGEKSKVGISCEECNYSNDLEIDLEKVHVNQPKDKINLIKLNEDISVEMRYPSYHNLSDVNINLEGSSEGAYKLVSKCIEAIRTSDERIMVDDEPVQDLEDFLESMTSGQFMKLAEFLKTMPRTTYDLNFTCIECGHVNDKKLEGMQNFF